MVCGKTDILIAAMARTCMTPQEIAEAAGVSVNVVYRSRRGYLVKMDSFGKICKALNLDPADAIDFERLEQAGKKAD